MFQKALPKNVFAGVAFGCLFFQTLQSDSWALVKVPYTDLSIQKLSQVGSLPYSYYNKFPYSPHKGPLPYFRIHQLKYNDLVKVKTCLKDEVECELPHCFYQGQDKKEYSTFWVLKQDLLFLKDLPSKTVLGSIPPPYRRKGPLFQCNKNVLTLTTPWFDPTTRKTYSVGTRFMRCVSKDTKEHYGVFIVDGNSLLTRTSWVPRTKAVILYPQTPSQATALFVRILKGWADSADGIIPYVFGGCSYTKKMKPQGFSLVSNIFLGEKISYWERNPVGSEALSGLDCSGMILCAAQICGIPYFYKNTFTIYQTMKSLKKGEQIQEGDLIWYSGHVMVVSDLKKSFLIEAAGYDTGHGRVHELSLDKVFKDIKNYKELVSAYEKGTPVERLHSNGQSLKTIYDLKLLSFKSLWGK